MRRAISLVSGVALVCSSAAFAAQPEKSDVPSNPNILAAVQQLQLNEAQQTAILQGIQAALTPSPSTGPTVLASPPLTGDSTQFVACQIANVGATPAGISIFVIGHLGESLGTRQAVLDPGHSFGLGNTGNNSQQWCRFVADVPASQLRANNVVGLLAGGTVASAEAR
jgi:hypothetical protein